MTDTMTITAQSPRSNRFLLVVGVLGVALVLAACDKGGSVTRGINSLGNDFVRVFNQDPNAEPVQDVQSLNLRMTPRLEPFNP